MNAPPGQREGATTRRRRWPWPGLALSGLIVAFGHRMAFSNLILARGDTFLYFYPYWEAAARALRAGRWPLWNPQLFMGAPFLANSQVGLLYPLNWPLWWLLEPPVAVKAAILLHLGVAAGGTYLAGRRALHLGRPAATVAAVLFALGGYLTAQVEHVNQLQGLAWLPWVLVAATAVGRWRPGGAQPDRVRAVLGLALLLALQLLAGHTQTTFLTGVGTGLWLLGSPGPRRGPAGPGREGRQARPWPAWLPPVAAAGALAALLAAAQLGPTLELVQQSARRGGLPPNEVLSFSLHPLHLANALLPGYAHGLFTEYVAFLPLTGLLLAAVGAWSWRRQPSLRPPLLLAGAGLLLALGIFNPLYWLLARLPLFNLFRVPARWLVLYALGMSLLAGAGWQVVWARQPRSETSSSPPPWRQAMLAGSGLLLALMGWSVAADRLASFWPVAAEAPYAAPPLATRLAWLGELALALMLLAAWRRWRAGQASAVGLAALGLAVLWAGGQALPYRHLTAPGAYADLRPPVARLRSAGGAQAGRLLSLSGTLFDPGDLGEIEAVYADQLDQAALFDYIVAVKQQEIVAPNLPLAYGLASVDGFDGGILPLRAYTQVVGLMLPPGVEAPDGRLREVLPAIPAPRWLDLFNVRYVITDKTGDVWRQVGPETAVYFDRQHPTRLRPGQVVPFGAVPPLPATALYVLSDGTPGRLAVTLAGGRQVVLAAEAGDDGLVRYGWPEGQVAEPMQMALEAGAGPWQVLAATLVNEEDGTFRSAVPGAYRLLHSGDVKIYENLDRLPPAFLVAQWQWRPDVAASVAAMAAGDFDPATVAVVVGAGPAPPGGRAGAAGRAAIEAALPERVTVAAEAAVPSLLVLTDAYYPGWAVTVDGRPAAMERVNGLFRGVFLAPGEHRVVFTYQPASVWAGAVGTAVGLAIWLVAAVWAWRAGRRSDRPAGNDSQTEAGAV